ncbi:MAG: type VI secretion system contractile sheath small subunit [Pirellulaceae bacterium]
MAKASGQKFIARNRAPRVQIEYDVEVYGAEKKIQLPFVMGVMADLSGNPAEKLDAVADRKFLEIDVDNFDDRMKAMKPRAAFQVPNTLTGEGNLNVDITFESMDDFSPAALARKVEPLRKLLETREQLSNLMTYMDGKTGAEELIAKVMQDAALMQSLSAAPNPNVAPPASKATPAPSAPPVRDTPTPAASAAAAPAAAPVEGDPLAGLLDDGEASPAGDGSTSGGDDLDDLLADL